MKYSKGYIQYAKSLRAPEYEPLTVEREKELLKEYANGSKDAFDTIIKAYLRFVIFLLKEFKIPDDVDVMDIIQEGNMGMIHGLQKFDSTKYSCRVSTYCVYWIRFFITKALSNYATIRSIFSPIPDEEYVDSYPRVSEKYPGNVAHDIIQYALGGLNNREKLVIILFYGLEEPFQPKTLQEIASLLHIHIERVRQLRDAALNKINDSLLSQLSHNK